MSLESIEETDNRAASILKIIRNAVGDIPIWLRYTQQQTYAPDSGPLLIANAEALLHNQPFPQATVQALQLHRKNHQQWLNSLQEKPPIPTTTMPSHSSTPSYEISQNGFSFNPPTPASEKSTSTFRPTTSF